MKNPPPTHKTNASQDALENVCTSLFMQIASGIFITDMDGKCLQANPRACELLGCSPDDIHALSMDEIVTSADISELIHQAGRRKRTASPEGWLKTGNILPIPVSISVYKLSKHQLAWVLDDLTNCKQAEQKYLDIFENAVEGIFQSTPQGRYLRVNPALALMLGYESPEEMIASITDIGRQVHVSPQQRKQFLRDVHEHGFITDFIGQNIRKDGSLIWTSTTARIVRDAGGKIAYFEGFTTDITERKQAEEAIRASEEKFFTAFQLNPALMAISSLHDGRFVYVNDTFLKALGFERQDVIGKSSAELGLFTNLRQREQAVRILLKNGVLHNFEVLIRTKNGENRVGLFSGTLLHLQGEKHLLTVMNDITERKQAEEALRLQALVLEQIHDCVTVTDLEGQITYVNDAECNLLKRKREDLIGQPVKSYGEDSRQGATQNGIIKTTLSQGEWRGEVVNYDADGRALVLDSRTQLVRDSSGNPIAMCGTSTDITERKQAEMTLRENEQKYRDIVESIGEGIVYVNQDGIVVDVNQMMCEIAGIKRGELVGKHVLKLARVFLESQILPRIIKKLRKLLQGKGVAPFEVAYQDKILEVSAPRRSESGFVTGVIRDVTDRKRAEETIQESSKKYQALFDASMDAIFVETLEGQILDCNQTACKMFGYSKDELLTLSVADLVPDEVADKLPEMITEELTTGGVFIEAVNKRQDGSLFPCEVSTRLTMMENQQRVLVYVHDITARKHAEQALKESEQRYRQIVEASPLGIYTYELDDDGRLIFVGSNPAADKIVGVESAQFLGLTLEEAFPPLAETGVPAHYRRAAREGIPWETEEIQYKHGRIEGIFQTFAFQTGKNRVTVMFQDVTERKLAEQTLQEQTEELEALFTVSTALRAARSTDEMLPMVLKQMRQVLDADAGAVALLDADQTHFTITLSDGDLIANTGRKFKSTEGLSGIVYRTHQPSVVGDISQEPERLPGIIGEEAIGPEAIVPLLSETEMLGVLIVERKKGRLPFAPQEIRLLSALGEMVGNTLRRTRLYDQALNRQARLQALHNIDLAITSSVDQRVTLDVLLSEVVTHLKVDAADVLLFNPQTHLLEYATGRGMQSQQGDRIRLGDGFAGRIAAERRVMGVADLSTSKDVLVYRRSLAAEMFQAYYGAPMISKGIVIGVLEVFHRTPIDANPDWVEFLEAVATQAAIAIDNVRLFDGLQRANLDLSLAYDATIEGWSRALDMRDKETEGHTLRVTEMTMQLARTLRVDETKLVHIRRGSLLHDIGKMGVADSILLKPGPLTESEWEIMRRHPEYAHEMLHPIAYLRPAIDIPYCHHERWDGSGYPRGLKEDEIPLSARIFAIVDVWDALTSDRPYRSAWPRRKVVEYIQENSGIQFDPLITSIFLEKYA